MKHEPFNESTEMYLKTIVELGNGAGGPVPISALAERMGVSTVSATEMVHRLQDQDLLWHTPYKGVALTERGCQWATALIRNHRLWECLLVEQLVLPWEQAHDFACRLEHATDTAVTEALAVFLNHPATCPHGNPIPNARGEVAAPNDMPLTQVRVGQRGFIRRIHPESILLLDYLAARRLTPGRPFHITEIAPFNGPIILTCDDQTHALGQEVAAHIFVEVASSE
jgi:DtxR family transcriptional regulator, Mn-dependent transcriptional regulator